MLEVHIFCVSMCMCDVCVAPPPLLLSRYILIRAALSQ